MPKAKVSSEVATLDSKELAKKVQEYKDSLKTKAEELVINGFPAIIVQLNDLLDTAPFKFRDSKVLHEPLNIPVPDPVHLSVDGDVDAPTAPPKGKRPRLDSNSTPNSNVPPGTKVMALTNGRVSCNKQLVHLISIVKPHIKKLVEDSNLLKMWISFMIPKIEDGNNFGVSIQEDTLAEVQNVESEAAAFYDQISRYFTSRAKLVSKVAKYPHIDDYRVSVEELDEKEFLSLWLIMAEIRNRYCSLHDIVVKNLEKIKKPRSNNATESLY